MSGSLWWWLRGLAEDVRKLALQAAVSFFFVVYTDRLTANNAHLISNLSVSIA